MKTVKQYLQEIPDAVIRGQALANLYNEVADEWSPSREKALGRAFLWRRSPEGYTYWHNIHAALVGNDPLPVKNTAA